MNIFVAIISYFLITIGVILPFLFRKWLKGDIFLILFYISPLLQLLLVLIGYSINADHLNKYVTVQWVIFISTIISSTIVLIVALFSNAFRGIRRNLFIKQQNIVEDIMKTIMNIFYYLAFPHIIFSFIYILWGLLLVGDFNLGIWDGLYFSFSLIYSLPESDKVSHFNEQISNNGLVHLYFIGHVLIAKFFELVVVAIIITRFLKLIGKFEENKEFI